MKEKSILSQLKSGLIVSCQALETEPLHGADIMAKMALAAYEGGAVGIRANTPADVSAIRRVNRRPLIGLYKTHYTDSDIYITPTMREIDAIAAAGADIVAVDATSRRRPGNESLEALIRDARARFPEILFLADISTKEEAALAESAGFHLISTTMSGYTPYSRRSPEPDIGLIYEISGVCSLPIIAEGKYKTPQQVVSALEAGAWAVVVGAAITRPQEITRDFVSAIRSEGERKIRRLKSV